MTQAQNQIIALISALSLEQRRELIDHLYEADMFGPGFVDRLSPQQHAELDDSIAQADRGQVVPSDQVFSDLAQKYGFTR